MAAPDMDVIKEIPGYKVILKAVLKSQIQQLVEQLASHTEEETVILTANIADGTLSHLGSDSGKTFLEDHEDIKSQFLGFCLKRQHKRKQEEDKMKSLAKSTFSQQSFKATQRFPLNRPSRGGGIKKPYRQHPYSSPQQPKKVSMNYEQAGLNPNNDSVSSDSMETIVKVEPKDDFGYPDEASNQNDSLNESASVSDSQQQNEPSGEFDDTNMSTEAGENLSESQNDDDEEAGIKVERISESDLELAITSVGPGQPGSSQESWDPNIQMMDQSGGASDFENRNEPEVLKIKKTANGYECPVCGKLYALKSGVIRHFETHGGILDNESHDARNSANDPEVLKIKKTENGFECPVCGKLYAAKRGVIRHFVVHDGRKDYECKLCSYKTNRKDNLKQHIITHHLDLTKVPYS